ncbi:unnamed protein product [Protopolystoma xenopodis]|uniref:Uncharacterized protein n=1 Tax=Protopolystoma xenopodis TaxID=117903 RepID=A0A3S5C6R6_9PLAT|nr:unnamed protein product [Protopolystoma xenopodis]
MPGHSSGSCVSCDSWKLVAMHGVLHCHVSSHVEGEDEISSGKVENAAHSNLDESNSCENKATSKVRSIHMIVGKLNHQSLITLEETV